jgi:hypothetical protein
MPTLFSAVVAENTPLRLTTDQVTDPPQALSDLHAQFTLHNMREILWEVFSRSLLVTDNELGVFSRSDLLRYYGFLVQIVEASSLVVKGYNWAIENRNRHGHFTLK